MVGDGEIGITKSFGDLVPASNAGPRANRVRVPDMSSEHVTTGWYPARGLASPIRHNLFPAPCRGCGGPSWLSDDSGAIHPCCELNGQPCVGCVTSETLNQRHRDRTKKKLTREINSASVSLTPNGEVPLHNKGDKL